MTVIHPFSLWGAGWCSCAFIFAMLENDRKAVGWQFIFGLINFFMAFGGPEWLSKT